MREFTIITDSSCDLPIEIIESHNIKVIPMSVIFDDVSYKHHYDYRELSALDMYNGMRAGKIGRTAGTNVEDAINIMRPELEAGRDIICLSLSSGISCAYQNACLAAEDLREEYPDAKIEVIDTKCASIGVGLMAYIAAKMKESVESFEIMVNYLRYECQNVFHYFVVDDLSYLQRSGRISHLASMFGSMLNIKPILTIGEDGKIYNESKVRGKKAAINSIVDKAIESCKDPSIFCIIHADALEDAKKIEERLRERYPEAEIIISYVGPIAGINVGPGTFSIIGLGKER